MRVVRPFFFMFLGVLFVTSCASADRGSLDRYAWQSRLFLVFADDAESAALADQKASIAANVEGYLDRDLVVFIFAGDRLVESQPPQEIALSGTALRKQLDLPPSSFAAVLIGLDTRVALRSGEPVDPCSLFREIDGMPIRQREVAARGGSVPCKPVK